MVKSHCADHAQRKTIDKSFFSKNIILTFTHNKFSDNKFISLSLICIPHAVGNRWGQTNFFFHEKRPKKLGNKSFQAYFCSSPF